ncbi:MAG: hypothetical protein SGPRY_009464, partial [Prymnesium sp.]
YRKYFSLVAPSSMADELRWLDTLSCPGVGIHGQHLKAHGRTASGASHAALAGRYPRCLNAWLLISLLDAAVTSNADALVESGDDTDVSDSASVGSRGDNDAAVPGGSDVSREEAGWSAAGPNGQLAGQGGVGDLGMAILSAESVAKKQFYNR